jgi:hypothetical protein
MIVYRPVNQSWWWKLLDDGSTVTAAGATAATGRPSAGLFVPHQSSEKLSLKGGARTDLGAR